MKTCSCCKIIKKNNQFYKDKRHSDGLFSECKECTKQKIKQIYEQNKEKYLNQKKEYYKDNREQIRKKHKLYIRNRRRNDLNFKMRTNLSRRITMVLKGINKSVPNLKLLGCSIDLLKFHLQSKFKLGMSFSNYGLWEIDHIIPCCSFDLSKPSEQRKCFHYTNLQPLWAKENREKGSK